MSKIDLATRAVVQTVAFPAGSRPWMLRVSPDGKEVWVQTGQANTNVVLDAETLAGAVHPGRHAAGGGGLPAGRRAAGTGWSPTSTTLVLVLDRRSGQAVTRIEVGQPQANASFTPDGATAFVSVVGGDEVVAIDMAELAVAARIPTGAQPMGLVLLEAPG